MLSEVLVRFASTTSVSVSAIQAGSETSFTSYLPMPEFPEITISFGDPLRVKNMGL